MPRVRTVGDRVSSRDSFSVWEFLRKRESKILKRRTWATCKLRKAKRQGYHIRFAYGDIVGPFWLLDIYISPTLPVVESTRFLLSCLPV